jgi:hypothetical protein
MKLTGNTIISRQRRSVLEEVTKQVNDWFASGAH